MSENIFKCVDEITNSLKKEKDTLSEYIYKEFLNKEANCLEKRIQKKTDDYLYTKFESLESFKTSLKESRREYDASKHILFLNTDTYRDYYKGIKDDFFKEENQKASEIERIIIKHESIENMDDIEKEEVSETIEKFEKYSNTFKIYTFKDIPPLYCRDIGIYYNHNNNKQIAYFSFNNCLDGFNTFIKPTITQYKTDDSKYVLYLENLYKTLRDLKLKNQYKK